MFDATIQTKMSYFYREGKQLPLIHRQSDKDTCELGETESRSKRDNFSSFQGEMIEFFFNQQEWSVYLRSSILISYLVAYFLSIIKTYNMLNIEVQYCIDCHLHNWCSRHNQAKYQEFYQRFQTKAKSLIKNINIVKNQPPQHYVQKNSLSNLGLGVHRYHDEQTNQTVVFPRHGSFQIKVNGLLIFSKLQSNLWPNIETIGSLLVQIKDQLEQGNDIKKFSLDYRLQNSKEDEKFVDTYKKVIKFKIGKRSQSQFNATAYLTKGAVDQTLDNSKPGHLKRKNGTSLKKGVLDHQRKSEVDKKALIRIREKKNQQPNAIFNQFQDFKDGSNQPEEHYQPPQIGKIVKNQHISPNSKKRIQFRNEVLHPLKPQPFDIIGPKNPNLKLEKKGSRKLIIKASDKKIENSPFINDKNSEKLDYEASSKHTLHENLEFFTHPQIIKESKSSKTLLQKIKSKKSLQNESQKNDLKIEDYVTEKNINQSNLHAPIEKEVKQSKMSKPSDLDEVEQPKQEEPLKQNQYSSQLEQKTQELQHQEEKNHQPSKEEPVIHHEQLEKDSQRSNAQLQVQRVQETPKKDIYQHPQEEIVDRQEFVDEIFERKDAIEDEEYEISQQIELPSKKQKTEKSIDKEQEQLYDKYQVEQNQEKRPQTSNSKRFEQQKRQEEVLEYQEVIEGNFKKKGNTTAENFEAQKEYEDEEFPQEKLDNIEEIPIIVNRQSAHVIQQPEIEQIKQAPLEVQPNIQKPFQITQENQQEEMKVEIIEEKQQEVNEESNLEEIQSKEKEVNSQHNEENIELNNKIQQISHKDQQILINKPLQVSSIKQESNKNLQSSSNKLSEYEEPFEQEVAEPQQNLNEELPQENNEREPQKQENKEQEIVVIQSQEKLPQNEPQSNKEIPKPTQNENLSEHEIVQPVQNNQQEAKSLQNHLSEKEVLIQQNQIDKALQSKEQEQMVQQHSEQKVNQNIIQEVEPIQSSVHQIEPTPTLEEIKQVSAQPQMKVQLQENQQVIPQSEQVAPVQTPQSHKQIESPIHQQESKEIAIPIAQQEVISPQIKSEQVQDKKNEKVQQNLEVVQQKQKPIPQEQVEQKQVNVEEAQAIANHKEQSIQQIPIRKETIENQQEAENLQEESIQDPKTQSVLVPQQNEVIQDPIQPQNPVQNKEQPEQLQQQQIPVEKHQQHEQIDENLIENKQEVESKDPILAEKSQHIMDENPPKPEQPQSQVVQQNQAPQSATNLPQNPPSPLQQQPHSTTPSINNIPINSDNPNEPLTQQSIPNQTEESIPLTNQIHSQLNNVYEQIQAKFQSRLSQQQQL